MMECGGDFDGEDGGDDCGRVWGWRRRSSWWEMVEVVERVVTLVEEMVVEVEEGDFA